MSALGSKGNPIRVDHVRGEHAYLSGLACPSGHRVEYRRLGSVGLGPHGNILDHYEVWCSACGWGPRALFFDMYHPTEPDRGALPEGFARFDQSRSGGGRGESGREESGVSGADRPPPRLNGRGH